MTPINELINVFEEAIGMNKENSHIQTALIIDDAKTILDALKKAKYLSEPCTCGDKISEKKVPYFCSNDISATYQGMVSPDYKERFKAEYYQTKIRYERLKKFNTKIEAMRGNPLAQEPKHDCPYELLREQQRVMGEYLHILEVRAIIEGIDL